MDLTKEQSLDSFYFKQFPTSHVTGISHNIYHSAAVIGAVVAAVSAIANIGSSIYGTVSGKQESTKARHQAQRMEAARKKFWLEHAYRSPEQIEAARKQGEANIESARTAGMERLTQTLGPSRGWGRGSGVLGAAGRGLEMEAIARKGELGTKLTELATTPMWPYSPSDALAMAGMSSGESSGYGGMIGNISDAFGTASGYINTLYGGGTGGGNYNWGNYMNDYGYSIPGNFFGG